ncbi:hypothetical protein N7462_007312 [Penicillium macrosclerotiorum]|uniref:uncharacterized protein n=1 Tax=Penicillium macrosclerotiorum TaxID=303699 RepID=UPI002548F742|nr:uncharacterized protein N7462_007312 [Penicillium macrosclerotiorum]KAJ5679068.1 hypothetical protein N7462_007312 [Penicillium macrosclerotiorum]
MPDTPGLSQAFLLQVDAAAEPGDVGRGGLWAYWTVPLATVQITRITTFLPAPYHACPAVSWLAQLDK